MNAYLYAGQVMGYLVGVTDLLIRINGFEDSGFRGGGDALQQGVIRRGMVVHEVGSFVCIGAATTASDGNWRRLERGSETGTKGPVKPRLAPPSHH